MKQNCFASALRFLLPALILALLTGCGGGGGGGGADGNSGGPNSGPANGTTDGTTGGTTPTTPAAPGQSNGSTPNPAYTATHFVTATATGTGDGSAQNPWTLAQAMANARAGDAVQVAPGIYEGASTGDGLSPTFRPSHDGTAAQPIVFFAQYPAATETDPANWSRLRRTGPVDSPLIGAGGDGAYRSHIVIDGFYFNYNEGAMPSTRGIVYLGFNNTGNKVRRNRFDRANLGAADDSDNYNCIQIHGSANAEISDNLFYGGYDSNGSHNESCITTYGALNFLIEHNTFQDVTTGIYVKGSFGGVGNQGRIRFNRFSGFRSGVELTENENGGTVEVYQNLFYGWNGTNARAAIIFENSVAPEHRNFIVHHNTIITPAPGGTSGPVSLESGIDMTGNVFRDNIVASADAGNTQVLINAYEIASLANFAQWDYNLYHNNGATPTFAINGAVHSGLAGWQSASGRDTRSIVASPQFEDTSAGDFRLVNNGQAALTASSTGGPVGCYITGLETIGIRAP